MWLWVEGRWSLTVSGLTATGAAIAGRGRPLRQTRRNAGGQLFRLSA